MSEFPESKAEPLTRGHAPASIAKKRPAWLPVVVLLVVFLAGFVPMWFRANRLADELFRAQRQSRVEQIQLTLADAALDARQGLYEPARQGLATFFSMVTAELDRGDGSALPSGAPPELQLMLAERDELITLLARDDPASAERLTNTYMAFRKTIDKQP